MEGLPKTRREAALTNSLFYFTGKPCKNGHVAKRYTKWGVCFECLGYNYRKYSEGTVKRRYQPVPKEWDATSQRRCSQCKNEYPFTEDNFYRSRSHKCKACLKNLREVYLEDGGKEVERKHKASKEYRQKVKDRYRRIRNEVFLWYGSKCACCGEHNFLFLTLDHKDNDGASHRKYINRKTLYEWVYKNGYQDNLQLLCWNCNLGKYHNGGVCPHQQGVTR
jgi:5-methylcytosine-specific restriction endonuclease McrA